MIQIKTTTIPVTGLTCTNCATAISANVRKLPGVTEANVDFASERLYVSFDIAQVSEKDIIASVKQIGYGVPIGKIDFPVTGLQDNTDDLLIDKKESTKDLLIANQLLQEEINQRKQTEKALQESEKEFRSLAESMPQIVWICRADGWNIYFNQQWVDYTGLTLDESYGHGWNTPFHPDDQQLAWDAWRNALNHNAVYSIEARLRRFDGVYRWWLVRGIPQISDSGEILKWFGTCTDIEEIKKAEEATRRSEEYFRNVFEHAAVGKSITGIDGSLKTNKAFGEILGYSNQELSGLNWRDITHPDDIETNIRITESILSGEHASVRWEKRYIHKDGHIVWADVSTVLQFDDEQKPLYFITTIQDITERKLAEEKLKETHNLIRIAGELAKLGGWNVKLQENRSYWSDEVAAIHEMPAGFSPLVEDGINFYAPEWREKITKVFTDCVQKGIPYNEEMEIITSSGKRVWIQTLGEAIKDENGVITKVQGAFQDISTRKKSEAALIESERSLRESQTVAHLGSYSWNLSTGFWKSSKILDEIFGIDENFKRSFESWKNIIHPDWQEIMVNYVNHDVIEKRQRFDKEYLIIRQNDGHPIWVHGQGELEFDKNGKPIKLFGTISDISDRKKAEETLRETNEYLENLFNYTNAPIIVWDPSLKITRFNMAFEKLSGYKADEVIGKNVVILFPENKAESSLELIVNTSIGARWETVEIEILRKDGEVRIVLWNSANILDNTQTKITATIAQGNDITQRKQTEEALLKAQKLLQIITDNSTMHIYALDLEGKFLLINKSLESAFGVQRESLLGKTREAIIPAAIAAEHRANDLTVIVARQSIMFEEENFESDGKHTYITVKFPLFDAQGTLIGIGGISTDITDRKQAEQALSRYTERLQNLHRIDQIILQAIESPEAIVQNALQHIRGLLQCQRASVGIFDFENKEVRVFAADIDGKTIVQVGMSMDEEMYGVVDILRQSRMEIVEDMSKLASPSLINKVLQAEGVQSSINVALISAQAMYGVLNIGWEAARYITQEESDIVTEVAGQITIAIEQAHLLKKTKNYADELEQRVIQRTEQLELANKELEAFSYSVSHDLRAPLRHISGFISLFLENKTSQLTSEELEYLDVVVNSSEEMGKLIDALLSFSRLNRSELIKEHINTSEIITRVLKLFNPEIQSRSIQIDVGVLPSTMADPQLINQVWTNLISNAIKYTGKKEKAIIEIGGYCENNETVFFIKDNGAGFNMKYANKLFTVFQRLHKPRDFEGIGIGLANIHRIVSRHGGRCWAEGEINSGATFYFSLPDN